MIRSDLTPLLRSDRGFALPSAILALVVVAFLVTTGIQMANLESRIGVSTDQSTRAFYVAESGMNEVLSTWTPEQGNLAIGGAGTTIQGNSGGGTWTVSIRREDDRLYLIRSTGGVPAANGGTATRVLGVMTKVMTADLEPPAALYTQGEVSVRGSAQVRGEDRVPDGWGDFCPDELEDYPGVVTDDEGEVTFSGGGTVTGSPEDWIASPDVSPEDFHTFGDMTYDDLVAMANVRYSGSLTVSDAWAVPDDGTGPCVTSVQSNWGDPNRPGSPCGRYFPIIHFAGYNASIRIQSNGYGQGIILVDGDLDLRGGFHFHGLIIVRGAFSVQAGGPRVSGAVMAENASLETEAVVGSSIVQNSRCAIRRAVRNNAALNRLRPIGERGWVDLTGISF